MFIFIFVVAYAHSSGIDSIFFLPFHKGMSNKQIFSSTSQKVADNRTNIISGFLCLFRSRGTLASSQIRSHSWLSNNTRRVLSPQSNQQPLQKCFNNIHKELLRLKISKNTPKAVPTNASFGTLHARGGVEIPSPLLFDSQPSSIFNSWACPSDFSKLSLFHTLFYWSGAEKSHTRGCCGPRSRALLWANASLAHQFFIEWLENSEGLARKMAGIMPLSTFDLTSMQRLASDTRGFTFCGVDLYIVVRGILWDVFVDRMGTQVSMGPSRISTPLSEESAYFSFLMSHLGPCIQLVRANP